MTVQKLIPKSAKSLQPARQVIDVNDRYVRQSIKDLLDTLAQQQEELDRSLPGQGAGVGIASNQIAYPYQATSETDPTPAAGYYPRDFIPYKIYVISIREARASAVNCEMIPPTVFINASYTVLAEDQLQEFPEACLSVNGVKALRVPRHTAIFVRAQTPQGEPIEFAVRGYPARVHQHEIDHGDGTEYLLHMDFNQEQLEEIRMWITQHKDEPTQQPDTVILKDQLVCLGGYVDYDALSACVDAMEQALSAKCAP